LVGRVQGKRVLELGCGPGHNAVAIALQGAASVIAVDGSEAMLGHARQLSKDAGAKVEWRNSDLAELAWLRADSVDIALSVDALGRAGFVVDIVAEPQREQNPDPRPEVPRVIAVRARKQGN